MSPKKKKSKISKRTWTYTYLVRVDGYGGELMIGTVSNDFAKFWEKSDSEELLSHILSIGSHPDEFTDVLHIELVRIDSTVHIQEIYQATEFRSFPCLVGDPIIFKLPEGVKGDIELDYTVMTKRKAASKSAKIRPVISSIYWEEGDLQTGVIQTDKGFDKTRMGLGLVKTDHGIFVNTWTYDGKVIPMTLEDSKN